MQKINSRIPFLLAALLTGMTVFAAEISFSERLETTSGNPVPLGAQETVGVSATSFTYTDHQVDNFITLGIDHDYEKLIGTVYSSIAVQVLVQPYDVNGVQQSSFIQNLSIAYDPFGAASYQDQAKHDFSNAYSFDFEVVNITLNGSTSANFFPEHVYLQGDIVVNRTYDITPVLSNAIAVSSSGVDLDFDSSDDELEISWSTVVGAEEYQLEWMFVNDYTRTPGSYSINGLAYDFRHNSTRVSTNETHYRIPMIFDHGYILHRVRAVGRDMTNPNKSLYSVWSFADEGLVSDPGVSYMHNTVPHEDGKNWQVSTSFAEDGKKKEVISYMDGTLRSRQELSKVNSDGNVVVGQTIYDFQGRPAINVLPTPVIRPSQSGTPGEASLKYYDNFNQKDDGSGDAYDRNDFDPDASGSSCVTTADGMSTANGASNYYSPDNPNKEAQQAYVPDAQKFPFSQVEYMPDNSGRLRRTSGLGADHQLGSGNETQYFYGKPNQLELDRLFGSEVGDATHYQKNMVIDANGQVVVAYEDMAGNVVATALAGDGPANLESISSQPTTATSLTIDLFEKDSQGNSLTNQVGADGNSLRFNQELLVATASTYDFVYDLDIDTLYDSCMIANVCFNCIYQLDIEITDDCGQLVSTSLGTISSIVGHFTNTGNGPVFSATCMNPSEYTTSLSFSASLNVGSYTLSKVLSLHQGALDTYLDAYLDSNQNNCFKTLEDFQQDYLSQIDTTDCYIDCQDCADALGDRDDFIAQGHGTGNEYDQLKDECMAPCTAPTRCEIAFEQMLVDMAPGGQYGIYRDYQGAYLADPLSVYNANNLLGASNAFWRTPEVMVNGTLKNCYIDDNGDSAKVQVQLIGNSYFPEVVSTAFVHTDPNNGNLYTYPTNLLYLDDFVALQEPSWMLSLVRFHPEYCYYLECQGYEAEDTNGKSSEAFDLLLRTPSTFSSALSAGLITLSGVTYSPTWFTTANAEYDPFITSGNYGSYATTLMNRVNNYLTIGGTNYSMAEVAAMAVRCGSQLTNATTVSAACSTFGTNTPTQDDEWQMLAQLYLGEKQKLRSQYEDEQAIQNGCYNDCIGNGDFNPFANGFFGTNILSSLGNSPYFDPSQPCSVTRRILYRDKVKRFSDHDDLPNTDPNAIAYQLYLMTGQCPNTSNLQLLLSAVAQSGQLTAASNDLQPYPEYGGLVLSMTNGLGTVQQTYWETVSSGSTLEVEWMDASQTIVLETLSLNSGGAFSWSDVVGFQGMNATGFNGVDYEFDCIVNVSVSGNIVQHTITGTTSINVLNCYFESPCEGNELAASITDVMSIVHNQGQLQGSYAFSSFPQMYPVVTQPMQNTLSAAPATLSWSYNSGTNTYSITTSSNSNRIDLEVQSSNPISFSSWSSITHFANLRSDGSGGFILEGFNGAALAVTLYGQAYLVSGGQTSLDIGDCSLPPSVGCNTVYHDILNDLEALLHDVLLQTPWSSNINLFQSPFMTSAIVNAFPPGSTQTTGTLTQTVDPNTSAVSESLVIQSDSGCAITLSTNPGLLFSELTALGPLVATGTSYNNAFHDFYMTGTFSTAGGVVLTDTIFGSSCIGILNCDTCTSDTSSVPGSAVSASFCKTAYAEFSDAITDFNASPYAQAYGLQIANLYPTEASFIAAGQCLCGADYATYLSYYIAVPDTQLTDTLTPVTLGGGLTGHPLEFVDFTAINCQPAPCAGEWNHGQPFTVAYTNPCVTQMINLALFNAQNAYDQYVEQLTTDFAQRYREHCMGATEDFTATFLEKEHHYTLYYYDQANNLIKTVPPEGVERLGISSNTDALALQIMADRSNGTHSVFTEHRMASNYLFNSLNQQVALKLPDHDAVSQVYYEMPLGLDDELDVSAVQFVSATRGYLSGYVDVNGFDRGLVYTTNDGGKTWQRLNHVVGANLNKVDILSSGIGLGVGDDGVLLVTLDNGSSWDMVGLYQYNVTAALNDVLMTGASDAIIVGDRSTVVLSTGGNLSAPTVSSSNASYPLDQDDHFLSIELVGSTYYATVDYTDATGINYGMVFKSTTGAVWDPVHEVKVNEISAVDYIDAQHAVAAGPNGLLLKTADNTQNWLVQKNNLSEDFEDLYFKDIDRGIALVDNGQGAGDLHKTMDGGATWQLMATGGDTYNDLYAYIDNANGTESKVLAAGPNGAVCRVIMQNNTPFGVATMTPIPSFSSQAVFGTLVSNKLIAVAGGNDQNLWFTVDGEAANTSWTAFNTGITGLDVVDIQAKEVSGSIAGVLLTGNGDLYGFHLDLSGSSPVMTTGLFTAPNQNNNTFSTIALNASLNRILAFNQTDGYVYRIPLSNALNLTAYQLATITPSGTGVFHDRMAVNQANSAVLLTGQSGHIAQGETDLLSFFNPITWQDATHRIRPLTLPDVAAINASNLLAVGDQGMMVDYDATALEGLLHTSVDKQDLKALVQTTMDEALTVGDNGSFLKLERQQNGSYVTTSLTSGTNDDLTDIALGTTEAYISGKGGTALYVSTYMVSTPVAQPMLSSAAHDLNGVALTASGTAVMVGDQSRVMVGGVNAVTENKQVFTRHINGLHFRNAQEGYLIGEQYSVRHTTDGGNTWSVVLPAGGFASGVPELQGVHTLGTNTAWICGDDEYLAKVSSEVATQQAINLGGGVALMDVAFADANTGFMVGGFNGGTALRTTNAGSSWAVVGTTAANLNALEILNLNQGQTFMAVGNNGTVAYFNGTSLITSGFQSSVSQDLHDVAFTDASTGYIVGDNGTVLKSNNATFGGGVLTGMGWAAIAAVDDLNGQTVQTDKTIRAIDFAGNSPGLLGGNYASGSPFGYARLLEDEGGRFSQFMWYDRLGRLVLSQNSKQYNASPQRYSYMQYDALGRLLESGEKTENTANIAFEDIFGAYVEGHFNPNTMDDAQYLAWLNESTGARKEVRTLIYDEVETAIAVNLPSGFNQENLRKLVSASTYEEIRDNNPDTYQHATHYDYDIHGNVRSALKENQRLALSTNTQVAAQQFKRTDYEYDLISGNTHKVSYQAGMPDAWHHTYRYDADNRITHAATSHDDVTYDMDAHYIYYEHGPLARTEIGENNVQGSDMAYTIQGWMKGMNSDLLDPTRDIGKDGDDLANTNNPNAVFARDAVGWSLGYFTGDYQPIDNTSWATVANRFIAATAGSDLLASRNDLYNGNIGHSVMTLTEPTSYQAAQTVMPDIRPQGVGYTYDQLNRLVEAQAYQNYTASANTWDASGQAYNGLYHNTFAYDANGNIEQQLRKDGTGTVIDDLTYHYADANGQRSQNRLYHVNDNQSNTALYHDDIDDMGTFSASSINSTNNYRYDEVGQLTQDEQEEIEEIQWTLDNKVRVIRRVQGSDRSHMVFDYDEGGNRIAKSLYNNNWDWEKTSYYVRDANGQVIAIYDYTVDNQAQTSAYVLKERNIYGTKRLGIYKEEIDLITQTTPQDLHHRMADRLYECSNHLGNVMAVITDRKMPIDDDQDTYIDYYQPEITLAEDYSPFGVLLYDRHFSRDSITITETDSVYSYTQIESQDFDNGNTDDWVFSVGSYSTASAELEIESQIQGGQNVIEATRTFYSLTSGENYVLSFDVTALTVPVSVEIVDDNGTQTLNFTQTGSYTFNLTAGSSPITMTILSQSTVDDATDISLDNLLLEEEDLQVTVNTYQQPVNDYRYAFNGMEKDDEVKNGVGNSYTTQFRQYDPRLGRWLSVDPVIHHAMSSYNGFDNNPIALNDPNGADAESGGGPGGGGKKPKTYANERQKMATNNLPNGHKPKSHDPSRGMKSIKELAQPKTSKADLYGFQNYGKVGQALRLGKVVPLIGIANELIESYQRGGELAEKHFGGLARLHNTESKMNWQYAKYLAHITANYVRVDGQTLNERTNHPLFEPSLALYIYNGALPISHYDTPEEFKEKGGLNWFYSEGGVGPGNLENSVKWAGSYVYHQLHVANSPSWFCHKKFGQEITFLKDYQYPSFEQWAGSVWVPYTGSEMPEGTRARVEEHLYITPGNARVR